MGASRRYTKNILYKALKKKKILPWLPRKKKQRKRNGHISVYFGANDVQVLNCGGAASTWHRLQWQPLDIAIVV